MTLPLLRGAVVVIYFGLPFGFDFVNINFYWWISDRLPQLCVPLSFG